MDQHINDRVSVYSPFKRKGFSCRSQKTTVLRTDAFVVHRFLRSVRIIAERLNVLPCKTSFSLRQLDARDTDCTPERDHIL